MAMLVFAFTPWEKNRRVKFAVMLCTVGTLAVFWGMSVSVIRAAVMLMIVYGGELFMRRGTTLNSLGFALFAILLFEPYAVFDAGLIMSFSGTFGVGVIAPALLKREKNREMQKLSRIERVKSLFAVSACAGLCVLPASAIFFGGFSVMSIITSVVILPFFTIAVGGIMLFAVFGYFEPLAQIPLLAAGIMSRIMLEMLTFLGTFGYAWIPLDYWFVPLWVVLALAAVAAVYALHKSVSKSAKAACITLAALLLMTAVYDYNAVRSERVYITISSDSAAALVSVRQGGTELLIITSDTPRIYALANDSARTPTAVVLLRTARNNEAAFRRFADNAGADYISPCPENSDTVYDISGKFTLDVRYTRDNEVMLTVGTSSEGYTILFTRASNDEASPANITVAEGSIRHKREFNSDYTVYVSRSIAIDYEHEHSAYFEPLNLILENVS
jgi:ComEC/Rec2-related protein